MSSYDGSRSARQSKRYSMSALYMSMSANDSDLVIEDELAKGKFSAGRRPRTCVLTWT
jgi:Ras GTPase-activating-like protein IQGAP2/3